MSNGFGSGPMLSAVILFGGLGEWFKPAVLKTADRMLNAVRPFESDILLSKFSSTVQLIDPLFVKR